LARSSPYVVDSGLGKASPNEKRWAGENLTLTAALIIAALYLPAQWNSALALSNGYFACSLGVWRPRYRRIYFCKAGNGTGEIPKCLDIRARDLVRLRSAVV